MIPSEILKKVNAMKPKEISTLDGVSVDFGDYWYTIRPSNTEPLLRITLESKQSVNIEKINQDIEKSINDIKY